MPPVSVGRITVALRSGPLMVGGGVASCRAGLPRAGNSRPKTPCPPLVAAKGGERPESRALSWCSTHPSSRTERHTHKAYRLQRGHVHAGRLQLQAAQVVLESLVHLLSLWGERQTVKGVRERERRVVFEPCSSPGLSAPGTAWSAWGWGWVPGKPDPPKRAWSRKPPSQTQHKTRQA